MRYPYCLAVWAGSLKEAVAFVTLHMLGDNVIQFVPDTEMNHAYWITLRVTGDQRAAIKTWPGNYTVVG